jgi:hypothetical protein
VGRHQARATPAEGAALFGQRLGWKDAPRHGLGLGSVSQ